MRLRTLLALVPWTLGARHAGARTDSVRVGGSLRLLEGIQGFQMASSPELASAINALLSDDATHMRMAPTRPATAADSARAAEIVQTARAGLSKYTDVKLAERDGYVKVIPWRGGELHFHYNK